MEVLIVGFASTELFGRELIEYFTRETNTSISRVEKFKYEFRFPKNVPSKLTWHFTNLIYSLRTVMMRLRCVVVNLTSRFLDANRGCH